MTGSSGIASRAAIATTLILAGCGSATDSVVSFQVTDSAGVSIAMNRVMLGDGPDWGIAATQLLEIGVVAGSEAYQFHRVARAARLEDGRIAVLDRGSSEVRFFSADGTHLHSVGGIGEGPGEFVRPVGLWRGDADSLSVWDDQTRRLSVLDPNGGFARSIVVDGLLYPVVTSLHEGGSFIAQDIIFAHPPSRDSKRSRSG